MFHGTHMAPASAGQNIQYDGQTDGWTDTVKGVIPYVSEWLCWCKKRYQPQISPNTQSFQRKTVCGRLKVRLAGKVQSRWCQHHSVHLQKQVVTVRWRQKKMVELAKPVVTPPNQSRAEICGRTTSQLNNDNVKHVKGWRHEVELANKNWHYHTSQEL